MKVFITGNMGYVGSVLNDVLVKFYPDIEIIGFDTGFFGHSLTGADFLPERQISIQRFGDVRDIRPSMLNDVDAVVHLAGISNDPIGREFENVTEEVNRRASVRLAKMASEAGVRNFVFASSCSMYGYAEGGAKTEDAPTNPLTSYARSKIGTEDEVRKLNLGNMNFTSLRFATACGWSTRLRLDLVLNDFVACAVTYGRIVVLSDGTPWRPLIDVEDMSRAIAWAITRPKDLGGQFLAINAGSNENNYQVKDLAGAVSSLIPSTKISINKDAPPDKRSYEVDFSLYRSLAPGYQPEVSLQHSIEKLRDGLTPIKYNINNLRESPYMRLNTLRFHINAGRLDKDLRWMKCNKGN